MEQPQASPEVAARYPAIVSRLYGVARNGPGRLTHVGIDLVHDSGTLMGTSPPEAVQTGVAGSGEMRSGA